MKVISFFILFISLVAHADSYSMIDLKAALHNGSYNEFFNHIKDIKPSKRDTKWKNLVLKAVVAHTKHLIDNELVDRSSYTLYKNLSYNNLIANSDIFKLKFYQLAVQYFGSCVGSLCDNDYRLFWKASDKNHDLANALFNIYQDRVDIDKWLLVERMALSNVNTTYCKQPKVQKILFENLIAKKEKLNKSYQKIIDAYTSNSCFTNISSFLKSVLTSRRQGHEEAFLMLLSKNEIPTDLKDFYLTEYLLKKPVAGQLFDMAWSNLIEISRSFSRRNKVISKFESLSVITDDILISSDFKKINAIFFHINDNFPEFIDYYASTCINYYKGTKVYSKGNPTLNCKKFFSLFKNTKWITENHKLKYKELRLL